MQGITCQKCNPLPATLILVPPTPEECWGAQSGEGVNRSGYAAHMLGLKERLGLGCRAGLPGGGTGLPPQLEAP